MPTKIKKILIVEPDAQLVELIRYPLQEEGYGVLHATDGQEGLRMARREQPDLVMVDYKLPTMKGNDFAKMLRKDPATNHQRVLMIADENQLENLEIGPKSNVDDFLIKPFGPVELITKLKPLLISEEDKQTRMISTGNADLDNKMGGGVPFGSLTLIEGDSGAGKSVLSQQMLYGSLKEGYKVTLFTSENTVKSLVKQMRSLNLDVLDHLLLGNVHVYPIETSRLGKGATLTITQAMKKEKGRDMIYIDSLTSSIPESSDKEVLGFFEDSKRLCAGGSTTVLIIIHSHGLTRELLTRLRSLCDAHLQLRTEEVGNKLVKTLEVTKVRGAEQTTGNIVSFEIEPGWGIRVIPINKAKG
ncbi:MAG: response regulator [Chloroflexi bacterium]|nr:response regulator [Chloroflexota bacterium]